MASITTNNIALVIPYLLLPAILFLYYVVFIRGNRGLLVTGIFFFLCGSILIKGSYYTLTSEVSPTLFESNYKESVGEIKELILKLNDDNTHALRQIQKELDHLRSRSVNKFITKARIDNFIGLIKQGDGSVFEKLDYQYSQYIGNRVEQYKSENILARWHGPVYWLNMVIVMLVLLTLIYLNIRKGIRNA